MIRWAIRIVLATGALMSATALPAHALSSSGEAIVVDANGQPLARGATSTEFTLELPKGAECQGDSQDGNYRIQSFFVPLRFDPSKLTYHYDAPDGEGNQPLWDTFTNPYMQGLTGVAKDKGGPGPIANTPMFSFSVYTPRLDLIPSGTYRTGLACTLRNKTTRYWDTEVRVKTDASKPAAQQITWTVSRTMATTKVARPNLLIGALGVAFVGGGVFVSRARRRSS